MAQAVRMVAVPTEGLAGARARVLPAGARRTALMGPAATVGPMHTDRLRVRMAGGAGEVQAMPVSLGSTFSLPLISCVFA